MMACIFSLRSRGVWGWKTARGVVVSPLLLAQRVCSHAEHVWECWLWWGEKRIKHSYLSEQAAVMGWGTSPCSRPRARCWFPWNISSRCWDLCRKDSLPYPRSQDSILSAKCTFPPALLISWQGWLFLPVLGCHQSSITSSAGSRTRRRGASCGWARMDEAGRPSLGSEATGGDEPSSRGREAGSELSSLQSLCEARLNSFVLARLCCLLIEEWDEPGGLWNKYSLAVSLIFWGCKGLVCCCFVTPGEGNSQLGYRQCHLSAETPRIVPRHCSLLVQLLVHFCPCVGTNLLFGKGCVEFTGPAFPESFETAIIR